ncbi:hypothetical protein RQP46_003526 [Phenoliferia psychrophenolica]
MVMIPFIPPLNVSPPLRFAPAPLPSETIDHILSYIDYGFEPGDAPRGSSERGVRNSDLALAARINRQWKEMAYSRLYRHLEIEWRFTTSPLLIRSFRENPALGCDAMWGWLAGFADQVPAIEELHLNSCTPWDDGAEPEPVEPEPVADEGGDPPAGTLNSLKRFWSSSTEASRQVFSQKPLNLEHVSLRDWEDDWQDDDKFDDVSGLTPLLPLLTELKSLRLRSTLSSALSNEFLSALSSSSVQDLTSNVLPVDRIAPHLPATLSTLHLTSRRRMGDPTEPFDLDPILSAFSWRKTTAASNLRRVTFVIPSLAAQTDVAATRKQNEIDCCEG